eukprot:2392039-Amphidinium_carterae.2
MSYQALCTDSAVRRGQGITYYVPPTNTRCGIGHAGSYCASASPFSSFFLFSWICVLTLSFCAGLGSVFIGPPSYW